jgi:M6 family metalloprotease-like protein
MARNWRTARLRRRPPTTRARHFSWPIAAAVVLLVTPGAALAADYPSPPPDFAHPGTPHSPLYSSTGGRTDRPMLVIYAEFNDLTFGHTSPPGLDAAYTADRYFGPFPSVADYFDDDSSGQLRLTPVAESDASNNGTVNDGVVSVSIDMDKSDFLGLGLTTGQKLLLEAADPFVDYSTFDADANGRITQTELVVHRQDVDPDPVGPGCATARRPDPVTLDGVALGGGGNLLMVNAGTDTNLITLAHETGHASFDMPDLYFWNVGSFDLAGPTCNRADDTLFRLNAWEKMHLGWTAPTVVTADGFYDVAETAGAGEAFILYDPDKGTDDYFMVENRARTTGTYDQAASDTGLVVWRLEDDEYTANGAGEAELGREGGFILLVEPSGDPAWDPSDPSTPERTMSVPWRDGTASNVAVRAIPAAGPTMRTFFDVRGPGVLVDPSTPQGTPMRVDVTPEEENRPPITVMNTGEATDDFAFDYQGLAAGWTSAVDRRTLGDHEEVQASPAIVPAANAPTGVHQVTIAGESESDGSVRSQAVFEVNVVLDRTEIVYTGPVRAPTGEPIALEALVTNPDDDGTPPVDGVEVTFELSGVGGTQSATATTGADGVASLAPVLTLAPGDYDLTVSTDRHGKHAPASTTVAVRIPTAAERVQDLSDEVVGASLSQGTERSLVAKLGSALRSLEGERTNVACNTLQAFVNEVVALGDRQIPSATANALIAEAESIRRQIGC